MRLRYILSQSTISLNQGHKYLTGNAYRKSDYDARGTQLKTLMKRGVQMISGHVRYCPETHMSAAPQYAFVTLLRDPIQRFVSHYNYLQRHHPDPKRPDTLEEFLETQDAARLASQYLFYFAALDVTTRSDHQTLVQTAMNNLSNFDLVGDLADPKKFAQDLGELTGKTLPIWRRNQAPDPAKIPQRLIPTIAQLCASDIEIYNAVHSKQIAA